MAWTDPRGDLRLLLNDDPLGRLVKDKRIFPPRGGLPDGTRTTFFTLEDRLVASGNQADVPIPNRFRLFLNAEHTQGLAEIAASGITITDPIRGEIAIMGTAPSGHVYLTATYFWREHLDGDLDFCLDQGAKQCNATTAAGVEGGLQLACLSFAGALAHRKMAERWLMRKSEQFLLEDAPAQTEMDAHVSFHMQQGDRLMDQAIKMRDSWYETLNGLVNRPAYGLLKRRVSPWTPKR